MNPKYKKIWLKKLRSGKYQQTTDGTLRECLYYDDYNTNRVREIIGYCCLGVLVDGVKGCKWEDQSITFGNFCSDAFFDVQELEDKSEVDYKIQQYLAEINDGGYTFEDIANWIEHEL